MKGLVHIYTGTGKGKTTAAIGLGIRACGTGRKVLMVQFLKGRTSGEEAVINRLAPDFEIRKHKKFDKFSWQLSSGEKEELKPDILGLFEYAVNSAEGRDLIILDEIMAAVNTGFIELERVTGFVKNKPEGLELVLTGRDAPSELVELADYVSDINEVKHPMSKGIPAREGVEF